jgi:hypothetical protein
MSTGKTLGRAVEKEKSDDKLKVLSLSQFWAIV